MKNTIFNLNVIKRIAKALGELNNNVIYVGGAVVSIYANDPAADDVRPTKDIDISLSVASISELEKVRLDLISKGFKQTADEDVICRFKYEDILVDVMNTKSIDWAPANSWFEKGYSSREKIKIEDFQIQILSLPYFLATKFEAYNNRGKNNPITSSDFEDIGYIMDNRLDFVELIENANQNVKDFLIEEFQKIINDRIKQEAIEANLYYENKQERFNRIMNNLNKVANSI
ncbi:MAG: nucleotidyl transferase AbiEii/AbiGii toxin family protein [Bacteroidota bacterium]